MSRAMHTICTSQNNSIATETIGKQDPPGFFCLLLQLSSFKWVTHPVHSPCYISTITSHIITVQGMELTMSGLRYISSSFQVDLLTNETFVEEFKLNKTNSVAFPSLFPWQPSVFKSFESSCVNLYLPSSFAIQGPAGFQK